MNIENSILNHFYTTSSSLDNLSIEEKELLKVIYKELKELDKSKNLNIKYDKIVFNYQLILQLSKKYIFSKQSIIAHNLCKKLIKHKIIDKKSVIYPKNIKFFSTNPLSHCCLNVDMKKVDPFINIFKKFLEDKTLDDDVKLYIYLRVFYIKKLTRNEILSIDENSFINIPNNKFLVINKKISNDDAYVPIKILFIDEHIEKLYIKLKETKETIFTKKPNEYNNEFQKFINSNNINYSQARIILEFVYQWKNTPLKLTLQKKMRYPKITLHEIDYIYPKYISKSLLLKEKKNMQLYFKTHQVIEDDEYLDINDRINSYIKYDLKEYDFLKGVLNFPTKDKDKEKFLDKWYKHLEKQKNDLEIINLIKEYILFILKKVDIRNYNDQNKRRNTIKMSTAKEYLLIAFKYAFNYIISEGEINSNIVSFINDNLLYNEKLTTKTISTYKRVINLFLIKFTSFNSLDKINSSLDVRRSIVFKNEFEEFVDIVHEQEQKKYHLTRNYKIKSQMRPIYLILLYYTGLRKEELRTRLLKDIDKINDNEFTIDVNSDGYKATMKSTNESELKLKTINAKRRVRFKVTNEKHLKMITEYLHWLEKNNHKFLFPLISPKDIILKKYIVKNTFFSDLSQLLQNHTKRYTPLHSLRHTFATRYFLKNINQKNYKTIMYELTNVMGHSDPETTIDNYIHIDYYFLFEQDLQRLF